MLIIPVHKYIDMVAMVTYRNNKLSGAMKTILIDICSVSHDEVPYFTTQRSDLSVIIGQFLRGINFAGITVS